MYSCCLGVLGGGRNSPGRVRRQAPQICHQGIVTDEANAAGSAVLAQDSALDFVGLAQLVKHRAGKAAVDTESSRFGEPKPFRLEED